MLDNYTIALGAFEMIEPIGQGGMARVWRGRHRRLGAPVAVKTLAPGVLDGTAGLQLFHREVRAQAGLHHPGIATIFDYDTLPDEAEAMGSQLTAGSPYLVMEYAEAGTLRDVSIDDWEQLRKALLAVLEALAHAHARQFVHRDLKPENILVFTDQPPARRYKLADFGLAHARERLEGLKPQVSAAVGTPRYMAPEQLRGQWRHFGPWTDLYQLGCMAYELVCGAPPYTAEYLRALGLKHLNEPIPPLRPRMPVPKSLEAWIRRLMSKDPAKRVRRAADAIRMLRTLDGFRSSTTADPSSNQMPDTWRGEGRGADQQRPNDVGLGLFGLREVPFVDREAPRDALWAALEETALHAHPRVIVVGGESGTGKSRLVEWVARRAHESAGCNVLRALHQQSGAAFSGLRAMVESWLQSWQAPRAEVWELARLEVARLTAQHDVDLAYPDDDLAKGLTEFLRPTFDGNAALEGPSFQLRSRRERLVLLEQFLRRLAARRPVIVWLDDIQWSSESIEFVRWFLGEVGDAPVFFVLTVRSDELDEQPRAADELAALEQLDRVDRVDLAPLDRAHHQLLVDQLLPLEPSLAAMVSARTEGHPLFAVQLIGAWADQELLVAGSRGYSLAEPAEDILPDDIHELWMNRLERALDSIDETDRPQAVQSIEIAAALGRQIDLEEWGCACAFVGLEPAIGLVENELVEKGLIVRDPDGLAFVHVMLLESLQRRSRQEQRWRALNRACAQALAELGDVHPGASSEREADHWVEADELERALAPLFSAINAANNRGDFRGKAELLDRRLALIDELGLASDDRRRVENWVRRGELLRTQAQLDDAAEYLERAQRTAHQHGWTDLLIDALLFHGYLYLSRGQAEPASEQARLALEAAESRREEARCHYLQAHICSQLLQQFDRARQLYERARAIFATLGAHQEVLKSEMSLSRLRFECGELDEAEAMAEQLLEKAVSSGNRFVEARTTNDLGEIARARGDWEVARAHYLRFRELNCANGSAANVAIASLNIALSELGAGCFDEASRSLAALVDTFRELGWETLLAYAFLGLSVCAANRQDWEAWDRHFQHARDNLASHSSRDRDQPWLAEMAGEWAARHGAAERAGGAYELAAELWEDLGEAERARHARSPGAS